MSVFTSYRMILAVYGADGRLNQKFLSSTKTALSRTAGLGPDLRDSYPLPLEDSCISGISRLSAHLHLLYHQVCSGQPFLGPVPLTWHVVHITSNKTTLVLLSENQTPKPRPQYQAPQLFGSRPSIITGICRLIPADAKYSSKPTKPKPTRLDTF